MKFNWLVCLCLLSCLSLAKADYAGVWTQEMAVSAAQDSEVLLLDVRSEQEFASGRVPGAKNIPYDELEARLPELSAYSDKTVVLYCHSGRRASIAESYLSGKGFTQLYHLQGDMQAWSAKGLAQERSN